MLARWLRRLRCRLTVASSWCKSAKTHLLSIFFLILCAKLFSFFLTDVNVANIRQSFWTFRQIVLYLPISVIEIAGLACVTNFVGTIEEGWEMTSDPLTKWQMLSLQSRGFVWRDKNDFSMSLISDPLCFQVPKSYLIKSTKAACLMFERLPMTSFSAGRVPKWVCA